MGAYYLFKTLPAGADPLDPQVPLIFTTGPLRAAALLEELGRRSHQVTPDRSHLFCITGGDLGPAMRRSGYDVIVLTGRSERAGVS